jgi:hypothetical protein
LSTLRVRERLVGMGRNLGAVLCLVVMGCGSSTEDANRGNNLVLLDATDDTVVDTGQSTVDAAVDTARSDDVTSDAPKADSVPESASDTAAIDTAPDVVSVDADADACPAGSDGKACGAAGHCCSGACVTNDSVATCGASCTPCAPPTDATLHQAATCTGGTCGIACAKGYESCDGTLKNGCETHTDNDTFNCGGCRLRCTWPEVYCIVGKCSATP